MDEINKSTIDEVLSTYDFMNMAIIIENSGGDGFVELFYKLNLLYHDSNIDMIKIILEYCEKNYDSSHIAQLAHELQTDTTFQCIKTGYYTRDDNGDYDLDDETENRKYEWIEWLYLLAIKKVAKKEDEEYISELLNDLDKTIEDIKNLDYIVAHEYTLNNKQYIEKSKECGCCYCMTKFGSDEVKYYIGKDTAVCPNCDVDAIVCDIIVPVTDELLKKMNRYWFG
ncbi:MAG: hypothetical protein U9O56_10790 [Campylobacterota bacterium]|nr:hypothetical protein [Campylobacterota bacterium]